jgi:predicted ATPase
MLTRLKVSGFKNLVDVDVHFGPFTCIAGQNGVGKSNLFDAIRFLSALTDKTFLEAAKSVRDEERKTGDARGLFHQPEGVRADRMRFEAELLIPREGTDEFGVHAKAQTTFLRYVLELGWRNGSSGFELLEERLERAGPQIVRFPITTEWRKSVATSNSRKSPFLFTELAGKGRVVHLHQEGNAGRTTQRNATELPRSVLSGTNASEHPTALLSKLEMRSWRLLRLEPSAMRTPDRLDGPAQLGHDGAHLPAVLDRLRRANPVVLERVNGRLRQLVRDVAEIADFSPLLDLPAFQAFDADVRAFAESWEPET